MLRRWAFTANFCHKHEPETKAKIENILHIIKQGFLKGRIYIGIDLLNVVCLEWLDRFANGDYYASTKRITNEMFKDEIVDAMNFCIDIGKCSVYELSSYLIYKHGRERARVYLHDTELAHFTKRAKEIEKEFAYGRHK